ncbi:hypothetical protein [Xylophilus sp. GOD-11R]|uniref:hypothetical protein n=1 Tax=Xylophilus sp. GOD-11R TaxID=3089814 RepID=UPI00298C87F4|nr:hypothetical protein [Xylophilus sp. GOD-11R]WPB56038.1 hypothetical protein R9X41_18095 [Xylophilus sp. GOD-11R]
MQAPKVVMSIKNCLKFVDAPLAIVVGGVAAVLVALQLAPSLLAPVVGHAPVETREVRMARAECLGAKGTEGFDACRQWVIASRGIDVSFDKVTAR